MDTNTTQPTIEEYRSFTIKQIQDGIVKMCDMLKEVEKTDSKSTIIKISNVLTQLNKA